jgi:hypothetical protein
MQAVTAYCIAGARVKGISPKIAIFRQVKGLQEKLHI